MINGLDIYYSKNIGRGLKPVSTNEKTASGLKPISTNKKQLLDYNLFQLKVDHVKNLGKV